MTERSWDSGEARSSARKKFRESGTGRPTHAYSQNDLTQGRHGQSVIQQSSENDRNSLEKGKNLVYIFKLSQKSDF